MKNATSRKNQRRELASLYAQEVIFWKGAEGEPGRAVNLLANFGLLYRYTANHEMYQKFVTQPKRWSLVRQALVDLRATVPSLTEQTKELWGLESYTEGQLAQAEGIFSLRDEVAAILQLAEVMIADYDSLVLGDLLNTVKEQVAEWDKAMKSAKEMAFAGQAVAQLGRLAKAGVTPQMWWLGNEPIRQARKLMEEQEQWLFHLCDGASRETGGDSLFEEE